MRCEESKNCCTCPERVSEDMSVSVNHWFVNFKWQGFRLHYDCLDAPGPENHICLYGICQTCGKCLCIGQQTQLDQCGDAYVRSAYRWCYQLWSSVGKQKLPEGVTTFQELFLSLFHPWDVAYVTHWLAQPENRKHSDLGQEVAE